MQRGAVFAFVALVVTARAAWPQGTPLGSEFRVNTITSNDQFFPSAASDASGGFVVVWMDRSSAGVSGQRYAASGSPVGTEFRANTFTITTQYPDPPSVASDAAGNFVVVWRNEDVDGSFSGVVGQRFAASGAPLGSEFLVNSYAIDFQFTPHAASDPSGNFVVVWSSRNQDGSDSGVFGQRYASSGAPLGPEFRVNTYTTNFQGSPSVAGDSSGNFVVVWESYLQDGSSGGVFGQRYSSSGAPLGAEFRVNSLTTSNQGNSSVTADASGNFVVAWESLAEGGPGYGGGVFARRFAASGAPLGPEFRVNTYTTNSQGSPGVASDSAGGFVVTWMSLLQEGPAPGGLGIFAQRYGGSGTPLGPEFLVNTYTTGSQVNPSVAADPAGNFVVVWQSYAQDGSAMGIFGQRYSEIIPIELMQFGVE